MLVVKMCQEGTWASEKDIKNGKKTTKQTGRVKLACHLEQTPKMHWRGPGAVRGMQVLKSKGDSQSIYMGVACQKLGMACQRGTPSPHPHLGVPLEHPGLARQRTRRPKQRLGVPLGIEGVARQLKSLTWACHLNSGRSTPATGTKAK
ncbi:hypothetical protein AHAS_Ahas06G0170100 [Arachis hypogaea]